MYLYARSVRRPPYPIYLYARSASRPPYPIYLYAGSASRPPCPIYLCAGSAGRPPYPIYLCAVRMKTNLSFNTLPACIHHYGCNNQGSEALKDNSKKTKGNPPTGSKPSILFGLADRYASTSKALASKRAKNQNQRRVTYLLGQKSSVPYTRWIGIFSGGRTAMPQQVKRSLGS